MPISNYLDGIQNATSGQQTDVNTATTDLSALQTGGGTLVAKLKEALNNKLNNNRDLLNQQADTMQNYFNAGAGAREKYQDVWNPFKKANLVQQERSMALRPYDVLSGVLENRMGSVNDIVQSGVQGWQGMTDAAGTRLSGAQSALATALQAYLAASGQQQAADQMGFQIAQQKENSRQFGVSTAESGRQFDIDQANRLNIAKMSGSGGGGVSGLSGIASLLFSGNETARDEPSGDTYLEPPFNVRDAGVEQEWPKGSGIIWESTVTNGIRGWK